MTTMVGSLHERLVFGRRTRVLVDCLSPLLPSGRILDVGCGDGTIDLLIAQRRTELSIEGVDILVRPKTHIPVRQYDGTRFPVEDKSFDAVMFVDVLHHTPDPTPLLSEAKRVARHAIVIKDHTLDGPMAYSRLRFMDWVGNAHHGVVLPYNYWPEQRWRQTFDRLGLAVAQWDDNPPLYPWPASLVFGRGLHFVARLAT